MRWHDLPVVKLVVAVASALTVWLFVEQALLRRWPARMARLAFVPLGRTWRVPRERLRGEELVWPAAFTQGGVEVTPPASEGDGCLRIQADGSKRFAAVALLRARLGDDALELEARLFPASLLWGLGMTILLLAVILTMSPTLPGAVISLIVLVLSAILAWTPVARARARAAPALDALVAKLDSPREPEPKRSEPKRKPSRRKGR